MKKSAVFLLSFLIISWGSQIEAESLKDGFLDLTSHDFEETVVLSGTWKFAEDHVDSNFKNFKMIKVPSPWIQDSRDVTYFLELILPEEERHYGLYIPNCNTAYKLTMGDEAFLNGDIGENYNPTLKPRFFQIKASGRLQITLNVTDRHTIHSGLISPPEFGAIEKIQSLYVKNYAVDALSIGALLLSGLFSLGIWLVDRRNKENNQHILALISFWMVIRFLTDYNRSALFFMDSYVLHEKLTWFNIPVIVALFSLYFRRIFKYSLYQRITESAIALSSIYALIVLFSPVRIAYTLNIPYELAMVVPMGATIFITIYDIRFGKKSYDSLYWLGVMAGGIVIFGGNALFHFKDSVLDTRIYAALIIPFQTLFTYIPYRKIYEKNSRLYKHKNDIFMRISDSIRTPLYGIIGKLDLLKNRAGSQPFSSEDIEGLDSCAQNLSDKIDYLLSVSKADVITLHKKGDFRKSALRPNIILIDDVPINRSIMKEQIRQTFKSTRVIDFDSGSSAFEYMASHHVDMIFCDLMMPEMDGFEFTRICRKKGYHMPLFIFSASLNKENRKRALSFGADGYLDKPLRLNEIKELFAIYL